MGTETQARNDDCVTDPQTRNDALGADSQDRNEGLALILKINLSAENQRIRPREARSDLTLERDLTLEVLLF